jgi:hypothetical protein
MLLQITDYITKSSLSLYDMVAVVKKGFASVKQCNSDQSDMDVLEKSRKLILRCYNMIASQQELSGAQVAMHIMGWPDHYTSHHFTKICLISVERYLQQCLDEASGKGKDTNDSSQCIGERLLSGRDTACVYVGIEANVEDALNAPMMETTTDNPDGCSDNPTREEMFSVQESKEHEGYTLTNIRLDYQHRGVALRHLCLYDYVSNIYRRKCTASDRSYFDQIENGTEVSVRFAELCRYVCIVASWVELYWASKKRTIPVREGTSSSAFTRSNALDNGTRPSTYRSSNSSCR